CGLTACEDEGDTVNVNGLDCGLVRAHLDGDWTVAYAPVARTLQNCDDAAFNGTQVSFVAGEVPYPNANVVPSPSSTSFVVEAEGPFGLPDELKVNVEADSCLALAQIWEDDDSGWVTCLGTADLSSRLLNVICDSFDLDTNLDGSPDTACDLNGSVTATLVLP
ncbi:MAG TPA: hypothetical protein VFD06_12555, partial [Candidatus Polarisedimenticolia bacterium]|nr:hypothetical protein [Candidatus Polarisedimenticolia bacterium]